MRIPLDASSVEKGKMITNFNLVIFRKFWKTHLSDMLLV